MASMAATVSTSRCKLTRPILILFACQLPMIALGAEVGGGIKVGASYTDNVFLGTAPDEVDEIVYQASPFLTFVHESPTLDTNLDYTFDWYKYSDVDSISKYHSGEASVTSKVWDGTLFTELGVRRSQVLSDPDDVVPSGNLPLSNNLLDEDEWWINPSLTRQVWGAATVNADYRYSKIQYDDSDVQDTDNQFGALSIENYKRGRGVTWALRYDWRRAEYEETAPWEYQKATAELGFWANDQTRVFGAGGKESAWDDPFESTMDDSFWELGFAHSAGENLSLEVAAGERSFGSSWRGDLAYSFRRGSMTLSYDELPTTTSFDEGARLSLYNPGEIDEFLERPGSAERYLSERLQLQLDIELRRTRFDVRLFDEDRSGRQDAFGDPLDDQSETGVAASVTWQMGARTELVFSGSLLDRKTETGNKSKLKGAGLDVNYRLGARTDLSLTYSYDEEQPRGENSSSRDYVANVVSLLFMYTM